MAIARLLAKGWIVFCLYAGAYALWMGLAAGQPPLEMLSALSIGLLLFAAMGLLFAGGYGLSARDGASFRTRLKPQHLVPDFNELVFLAFVVLSFIDQILFAPQHLTGPVADALENAVDFAIPGHHALLVKLSPCAMDGGRIFASAFTWMLALIFLGSALSRIRLAAALLRLERSARPEVLGATAHAAVLGVAALIGIQLFVMGSLYGWIDCGVLAGLTGALLIGLAPLMLAYLIVAALTALVAMGPE
jgi:hypothetical protein